VDGRIGTVNNHGSENDKNRKAWTAGFEPARAWTHPDPISSHARHMISISKFLSKGKERKRVTTSQFRVILRLLVIKWMIGSICWQGVS